MLILLSFLLYFINSKNITELKPEIKFNLSIKIAYTNKDIFAESINTKTKKFIPANTRLRLLNQKINKWFKIFEQTTFYIEANCVEIEKNILKLKKVCAKYKKPYSNLHSFGSLNGTESFEYFSSIIVPQYEVKYNKEILIIEAKYLKFKLNFDKKHYEKIPIATVSKIKTKVISSKNIDKTSYMATQYGILISQNSKDWYRILNFKNKKYKIAITDEGCLLANTLYSCDFGKTVKDLFPPYAIFGQKLSFNELLYSPNGMGLIFLSFLKKPSTRHTYIYSKSTQLWERIHPNPQFTFAPTSVQKIADNFIKDMKKKYNIKIKETHYSQSEQYIYISINGEIKKQKLSITKVFTFHNGWEDNQKEKLIYY